MKKATNWLMTLFVGVACYAPACVVAAKERRLEWKFWALIVVATFAVSWLSDRLKDPDKR